MQSTLGNGGLLHAAMNSIIEQAAGILDAVGGAFSRVSFSIGHTELNLLLVLKGLIALIALQWLAGLILRRAERRLMRLKNLRPSDRTLIIKFMTIALYFFVFVFALQFIGIDLTALSVLGGALGVGLGFGLQKIASNFISGIILLFEKSIEVDDMIELADGTVGFVRRTYARYTRMETQDGREILIPNEEFITQRVTTLTHSNRHARVEIKVNVAFDSDFKLVMKLMIDAALQQPQCLRTPEPNCFLTLFGDSGVEVMLHFWIEDIADGRLGPKSDAILAILEAFREHHITIPYPQREWRMVGEVPAPLIGNTGKGTA